MSRTLSLALVNQPSEVARLVDRLESFGLSAGLAPDVIFRLTLALDEVVSNVVHHAFDDGLEHRIEVRVDITGTIVTATVLDDGCAFDPREAPLPDLDASLDARRVGGLGMHLVRSTMDTIAYRREGTRNILTMTTSTASREFL